MAEKLKNPMRKVVLDKVTINLGCAGESKEIEKAEALIKMMIKDKKPMVTISAKRSSFGVGKGKPVGVKLTLRGKEAIEFAKIALAALDDELKSSVFDNEGNFSFGVKEYIEMPGIRYNHDIGMFGFDVSITLKRSGFNISKRKVQTRKIPQRHKVTKEESAEWAKTVLGAKIIDKEQ